MKLFLDIETIPSQKPYALQDVLATIKHPGNITKQESIEKWYAENAQQAAETEYRKQSFDGLLGEIISIAWAFDDYAVLSVSLANCVDEKEILEKFFASLSTATDKHGNRAVISKWIGHYITGFDLRFIWQRCVVNQVKPLVNIPYDAKPWSDDIFDTKIAWSGSSQYSGKSSLDALCKGFCIEGKGDIDGSKVYDYFLDGKIDEIEQYNRQDVEKCRQIYKLMTFQG